MPFKESAQVKSEAAAAGWRRALTRGFTSEEYRGGAARGVEKLINKNVAVDDDTLSVMESWLESVSKKDEPADKNEADESDVFDNATEEKKERRVESILWGMSGFSVLPHGNFPILEAIARIYLQRKQFAQLLEVLNKHVARQESEKVWTALLRLFPYIQIEDKASLANFYRALFQKFPAITATPEAVALFAHIHWSVPDIVRDVLLSWEQNSSEFVQQAYGELAGLLYLMRPELEWPQELIAQILKSDRDAPSRTGAAYAAVHVWAEMPEKDKAPHLIRDLTAHAGEVTWMAIIDLFRLVDEITPDAGWIEVLNAIADEIPRQPQFMSSFVIERLQTVLPHQAELVASISKTLVEKWSKDLGDIRTEHASIAPELIDIAITLHRLGSRTREAGLEVFEKLLTINAYTARETLDQIDNRFRQASRHLEDGYPVV